MSDSQVFEVFFPPSKKTVGRASANSESEINNAILGSLAFDLEEVKKRNAREFKEIE
jgi:hypothetical protein